MKSCKVINPFYNQRLGNCQECGEFHWFNIKPFKIDAYNIKYKMEKDYNRVRYAKDLLQPIGRNSKRNEDFYKVYGDPTKQQAKGNTTNK